ncbi:MAG TPA: VWA domain-containing protein [Pseudonocardiaceae bacterium]|nr:VWA domain-containing protein [Pseudonocardiaceae bacterium]
MGSSAIDPGGQGVEMTAMSARSRRPPRPMPVVLLVDVSGSMDGEKIELLNRSVAEMLRAFAAEDSVRGEIHVAVIVFGGETARLHQPITPAVQVSWAEMTASGRTPLGAALTMVNALLADQDVVPDQAFPATLVLVSDGAPTDEWQEALDELLDSRKGSKALRLAVGIGSDRTSEAEEVLRVFSTPGQDVLRADQVHEIAGLFRWVTATVTDQLHERTGRKPIRLEDLGNS